MRPDQVHGYELKRAKRDAALARALKNQTQAELDRIHAVLGEVPALPLLVSELAQLHQAADPTRGRNLERSEPASEVDDEGFPVSRSEGDATAWARAGWTRASRRVEELTSDVQAWLGTPPSERAVVDDSGKCVTCGRRPPRRVRVSRDGVEER